MGQAAAAAAGVTSPYLTERDWSQVVSAFNASSPYNYAILDDFLQDGLARDLRDSLIRHFGWRQKNWVSRHLHNDRPDLPAITQIVSELHREVPALLGDTELLAHWAIMYTTNQPGSVHADHSRVTLNLWLTPDEHNLDPKSGGIVLHDVKRPWEMAAHEHLGREWAEPYVRSHSRGGRKVVPYRFNRAILFDGRTFHQVDRLNFANNSPDSYRINLAFAFDDPAAEAKRVQPYLEG